MCNHFFFYFKTDFAVNVIANISSCKTFVCFELLLFIFSSSKMCVFSIFVLPTIVLVIVNARLIYISNIMMMIVIRIMRMKMWKMTRRDERRSLLWWHLYKFICFALRSNSLFPTKDISQSSLTYFRFCVMFFPFI